MPDRKQPVTIVIFGASGDLTRRKLVPGLFSLFCRGVLPEQFAIAGFARSEMSSEAFRQQMRAALDEFYPGDIDPAAWQQFAGRLHYMPGGFTDAGDYARLASFLTELENDPSNRLYYLATAPQFFGEIIDQ